jgi:hypothetical protein
MTGRELHTLRGRFFLLFLGLLPAGFLYAATPLLHGCSLYSVLGAVLHHLSTCSCNRLGCFQDSPTVDIFGSSDYPYTAAVRRLLAMLAIVALDDPCLGFICHCCKNYVSQICEFEDVM